MAQKKAVALKVERVKKTKVKPVVKKKIVRTQSVVKKPISARNYLRLDPAVKNWFQLYFRYVNYLGAACLYLKDNVLLREELKPEHLKDRPLGHWGTVPGLNLLYMHANYLVYKYQQKFIYITGPGHGAPATLMNVYAEGTLGEYVKEAKRDANGIKKVVKGFSWPYQFHSHVTPDVPGSILEGGELGYSLSTAFGAVMDSPDLIALCVVGDGEAETGALATAWHGNKFLNPKTSGAVLPVVHINGYKISGPTIYSTMSDEELENLFRGYGYKPYLIEEEDEYMHECIADRMERAYQDIHAIWRKAREEGQEFKPQWPVILMRSKKGWTGPQVVAGKQVEDNCLSHGLPLKDPKNNQEEFAILKNWLLSYRFNELIDLKGRPTSAVLKYVPTGNLRISKVKNSYGGEMRKALRLPKIEKFAFDGKAGEKTACSPAIASTWLNAMLKDKVNYHNFRLFCPDETESNRFSKLYENGKGREYQWPIRPHDEHIVKEGRVTEMLSEQTLQGFLQGYVNTGRHGLFVTYEAFAMINASMVDQHCKFLTQIREIKWRKPVSSLNYILSSNTWRQEHNGFSHQNPGIISNTIMKNGEFASAMFPVDGNHLMVTLEDCFNRTNGVNMIAVGKNDLPQWLSVKEARLQQKKGVMIWDFLDKQAAKDPDVVMVASGDFMVQEVVMAMRILKAELPELKIRVVYVSEISQGGLGHRKNLLNAAKQEEFNRYFTKDKPVIYNYHGYTADVKQVLFGLANPGRMRINGYQEKGSTTTPFDMLVINGVSRFNLIIEALQMAGLPDARFAKKAKVLIQKYQKKLLEHHDYIRKTSLDLPEVTKWNGGQYYQTGGS